MSPLFCQRIHVKNPSASSNTSLQGWPPHLQLQKTGDGSTSLWGGGDGLFFQASRSSFPLGLDSELSLSECRAAAAAGLMYEPCLEEFGHPLEDFNTSH